MLKPTRETPLLGNGGLVVAAMIAVMLLGAVPYQAQESPMEQRLNQLLRIVAQTESQQAFRAAIYGALEELTANRVPVVSKGLVEQTGQAAEAFTAMAGRLQGPGRADRPGG